jgi:hypothetical protein
LVRLLLDIALDGPKQEIGMSELRMSSPSGRAHRHDETMGGGDVDVLRMARVACVACRLLHIDGVVRKTQPLVYSALGVAALAPSCVRSSFGSRPLIGGR